MTSVSSVFGSLLHSAPSVIESEEKLDELIDVSLRDVPGVNNTKQWEYLFRNAVLDLAATESTATKEDSPKYYDQVQNLLDLVLRLTEKGICDPALAFIVLGDLLETQTIESCSQIFSWVEKRSKRLTVGMEPAKGKSLNLLRTLNDLLRRLSKTGNTTVLCGRILAFLSSVFPLSERSAVNLRGEYGPKWDGVHKLGAAARTGPDASASNKDAEVNAAMDIDEARGTAEEKKLGEESKKEEKGNRRNEFYDTFWSLQLPFSQPSAFTEKGYFAEFQIAVNKVLPVIREATSKERLMMGSRASNGGSQSLKRKRGSEPPSDNKSSEYFFAKFLTSPDLLDLEIADTHFRRQVIFQLLILLNHLLTFTKQATSAWYSNKNRSLQMDFVLEPAEAQWVKETITKGIEELRQTAPNGRTFAETVIGILERDKNWIKWKNDGCPSFDKGRWSTEMDGHRVGLIEAAIPASKKLRQDPEPWPYQMGNEPLTEIWELGYRGLSDLQIPFIPGTIKDYVKKINQDDARIKMRKSQLEKTAERLAGAKASAAAEQTSPDAMNVDQPITPRSIPSATTSQPPTESPLHPSLPLKPGTPSKPPAVPETPQPAPPPTPIQVPPASQLPPDPLIVKHEESKQRWSWFALRTARDQYLQHFEKIGTGDILMLAEEIENAERKEREEKDNATKRRNTDATRPSMSVELPVQPDDKSIAGVELQSLDGPGQSEHMKQTEVQSEAIDDA